MSISLLANYATYTNVVGGADFFDKFRSFAVSTCGWVEEDAQTDKVWGLVSPGVYGWIAGDEDYLAISSVGYGAQTMRFEFRRDPYDGTRDKFAVAPINPNYTAISTASATHPIEQPSRCWQTAAYRDCNMPHTTYEACHFYGDDKRILVINQYTAGQCVIWGIGTPELYPELQTRTDLWHHFFCHNHAADAAQYFWDSPTFQTSYWFNGLSRVSNISTNGYNVWLENAQRVGGTTAALSFVRYSMETTSGADSEPVGGFENYQYLVRLNSFSNKRTIIQPRVYYKNASTSIWFPGGVLPVGWVKGDGLSIGETIDVGSETFRVYPPQLSSYSYWMAFRAS